MLSRVCGLVVLIAGVLQGLYRALAELQRGGVLAEAGVRPAHAVQCDGLPDGVADLLEEVVRGERVADVVAVFAALVVDQAEMQVPEGGSCPVLELLVQLETLLPQGIRVVPPSEVGMGSGAHPEDGGEAGRVTETAGGRYGELADLGHVLPAAPSVQETLQRQGELPGVTVESDGRRSSVAASSTSCSARNQAKARSWSGGSSGSVPLGGSRQVREIDQQRSEQGAAAWALCR